MEKRIHLYVSKKHPALWLTALLMLGICAAWQLYLVFAGKPLVLVLSYIGILFFCGSYTSIRAGKHKPWRLLPLYLLSLGMVGYMHCQHPWRLYLQAECCSLQKENFTSPCAPANKFWDFLNFQWISGLFLL